MKTCTGDVPKTSPLGLRAGFAPAGAWGGM